MNILKKGPPFSVVLLFLSLLGLGGAILGTLWADPPGEVKSEDFKPRWNPDDSWVVETATKPVQARHDLNVTNLPPVSWKFTVKPSEKIAGHECHRLEVVCLDDKGNPDKTQPGATLWIDQKSMVLRQLRAQFPVPGGFRSVTESYVFGHNQPSPVIGPLTALPLDLPLFTAGKARGLEKFSYEAVSGPEGKRAADDVAFAIDIEQTMAPARAEEVNRLVAANFKEFSRDLKAKAVVEVNLKTAERNVRQLWQAGHPWPLYANNGPTTARLLKVTTAPPRN